MRDIPVTWAAVKTAQAEAIAARDDALAAKDVQIAALEGKLASEKERCDIVADSNYAAGMLLGWDLCFEGKDEEHNRIRERIVQEVAKAFNDRRARAALEMSGGVL